jgi:hypothetical protein
MRPFQVPSGRGGPSRREVILSGVSVSERLFFGRLRARVSDVVDAGTELLPHFAMAVIPVLEGMERPGEDPALRRRVRAEGIRPREHRGAFLLEPGELDKLSAAGFLNGGDELYLFEAWDDEIEPFIGRITPDVQNLGEATPLGLEEWMLDVGCLLALGDGDGLNYATPREDLHVRLRATYRVAG